MSIPNNTIGYGAIFLPEMGDYQGFYVTGYPDDPQPLLLGIMAMATGHHPVGVMEAVMVEMLIAGKPDHFAAAATAYAKLSGRRFFYIVAAKDEGGTDTKSYDLKATSISAARDEINALPMAIDMRRKKGL